MHFAQQCSWDRFNTRGYSFGGQPEAKNMTLSSICNALATTRARGLPLWCMQQLFAASPSSVAVVQRTHSAARTYSAASQGEASNEVVPSAYSDYEQHDVCIVGGGIVGLATAREIINRYPKLTVCVLEKEKAVRKITFSSIAYSYHTMYTFGQRSECLRVTSGTHTYRVLTNLRLDRL